MALLFAVGVHPQVIQAILGHSALPMFSSLHVHAHLFLSLQQEAMDRLSDLLVPRDVHDEQENDAEDGATQDTINEVGEGDE